MERWRHLLVLFEITLFAADGKERERVVREKEEVGEREGEGLSVREETTEEKILLT